MQKYNQGGDTSDRGTQLNDFYYSKYAILESVCMNVFSSMGQQIKQRKHYGETFKCYREFPIIHDLNKNAQGIDADGIKMLEDKWYSWNADGVREEHATKEEAKARAGQVRIESGNGNLGGSDRDFSVQNGAIPVLTEEGGLVNGVGLKRALVVAKIKEFGMFLRFTKRELELDTQEGLLTKYTQRLGEAYGTIRERQIRNTLISAGLDNVTYAGTATSMDTVLPTDLMNFKSLRLLEQSLDFALCPTQTTIVTGSTKIGTIPLPASRFMFVPYELKAVIEDMVNSRNESVFKPLETYKDATPYTMENELGSIGRFRFVLVHDMPYFEGAGAPINGETNIHNTNGKVNVYPALVVGDDAFATMALEGDIAQVKTVTPKADASNDVYGKRGSVSISWYFGLLIKRPERIRVLLTAATIG